jgi:hypothetical protein
LAKQLSILCAGLGALLVAAAGARAGTITLLSPIAPLRPPPPLLKGASSLETPTEVRFFGHLRNRERVVVGLEDDGSAASVVVTQRLVITRKGDFSFIIPAPAASVVPGPGTQAQPGLRDVGIVWQGFSGGRRVLAATATLSLTEAESGLPLSISVRPVGKDTAVTLANIARRPVTYESGTASLAAVQAALVHLLDLQRRAGEGAISGLLDVTGTPAGQVTTTATAPLRVRGRISVPGRKPVSVAALLGDARSIQRTITLPGRVSPKIELRIDLLRSLEILPRRGELAGVPNPVTSLQQALARTALSWQFRRYLDSPDQLGPSTTTYVYRTLAGRATVAPVAARRSRDDTLAIVLGATLGGVAMLGLALLWARS